MKLSEETILKIPILYKKLGTKKQVAEQLNISPTTVSKYLNLFEAAAPQEKTKKEKKKRIKITDEIIEKINQVYSEQKNLTKTAEIIGCSIQTIKKYLTEENLNISESQKDDRDALFFYIYNLFGQYSDDKPVSDWNLVQMQNFKKQGMSYKGQLLTLKYFYEVKKNSIEKSNGSIGIIKYVWDEAERYYTQQAEKAEEFNKAIQRQLEQDRLSIKYNPEDYVNKRRRKKTIDLNSLGGESG
jgi:predicted transcriptional regulator